jgi:hypothetical protein
MRRGPLKPPARKVALALVAGAIASLAAGIALYVVYAPPLKLAIVELGEPGQQVSDPRIVTALRWDLVLIAGCGIALGIGTYIAMWFARTRKKRLIVLVGRTSAALAIVADLVADLFIYRAHRGSSMALDGAAVAATIKFCALVPAALVALFGLTVAVKRAVTNRPSALAAWEKKAGAVKYIPPMPVLPGDPMPGPGRDAHGLPQYRWSRGFRLPDPVEADIRSKWEHGGAGPVAVCLSGGGIRAASTALGAMQTMRKRLLDADYLISVSGGGYTNGAFAQALTSQNPPHAPAGAVLRDPSTALGMGSVTVDHIRRHASYIATTVPQLALSILLVLRHLLLSLAALFGPAILAGVAVGAFYRAVPLTQVGDVAGVGLHRPYLPSWDQVRPAPWIALGILTLAALLVWLAASWSQTHVVEANGLRRASRWSATWRNLTVGSRVLSSIAVVALAMIVVIPTIAWSAAWLFNQFGGMKTVAIGGPIISILLTYGTTLFTIVYRKRVTISKAVSGLNGKSGSSKTAVAAVPSSALQLALVGVTLGVLGAAWLLLFGGLVLAGGTAAAWWTALGVGLVVVLLGGFVDETTLSLHPFYRQRLAGAFAVRAFQPHESQAAVALPYDPAERTTLSQYGRADLPFPQQVFAATAHLSSDFRTASGHSSVSFAFNADYVGGPDVGWLRTSDLERLAPPRLLRDLTAQAAVAISGAAFASTKGSGSTYTQVLMTISGLRLGSWLPNPASLHAAYQQACGKRDWRIARPPRVRRIDCLVKEIFNIHQFDAPLLQVTDGGHYENLGLLEALRRRCGLVLCIDASGDTPPTASTLAHAVELARSELGVEIKIDNTAFKVEPGSGRRLQPHLPLSSLTARMSAAPIITGTITYPPAAGIGENRKGKLILAKAVLWDELPYDLLSYAAKNELFPRDATGDQFFDSVHFDAYALLGQHLGAAINSALEGKDDIPAPSSPVAGHPEQPAPLPEPLEADDVPRTAAAAPLPTG